MQCCPAGDTTTFSSPIDPRTQLTFLRMVIEQQTLLLSQQ
jgi:hypothetical protein